MKRHFKKRQRHWNKKDPHTVQSWQRHDTRAARHGKRIAKIGQDLENRVEEILKNMVECGVILTYARHEHHSPEDLAGCDFTVTNGDGRSVNFGVTVSARSARRARFLHNDVEDLHFPVETKDETIRRRILALFEI